MKSREYKSRYTPHLSCNMNDFRKWDEVHALINMIIKLVNACTSILSYLPRTLEVLQELGHYSLIYSNLN